MKVAVTAPLSPKMIMTEEDLDQEENWLMLEIDEKQSQMVFSPTSGDSNEPIWQSRKQSAKLNGRGVGCHL